MLETEYLARQNSLVDSVSKKLNYQVNYDPGKFYSFFPKKNIKLVFIWENVCFA